MGEVFAGRYELVDPIGRGGAGAVWRAWDHRRRRYVAAKVLQQSDAHALLRFVREQALRIDHPHVLAPASWAADDDKVLFTMDLVAGGSLVHLVGDYGPLPPAFVCTLLDQLLSGLAAVHAEGVVHRDVKPANVLLEATGTARPRLRLSDFGVAMRLGEPRLTETDYVVGTPGYLAPEQLMGADPDFTADLFAVGLVALYLLQGARPDSRALVQHFTAHGTPGAPRGVPGPLWEVVATLLQPDPAARFRTATGARKALAAARELLPEPGSDDERTEIFEVEIFDQIGPLPQGFGPEGPLITPSGVTGPASVGPHGTDTTGVGPGETPSGAAGGAPKPPPAVVPGAGGEARPLGPGAIPPRPVTAPVSPGAGASAVVPGPPFPAVGPGSTPPALPPRPSVDPTPPPRPPALSDTGSFHLPPPLPRETVPRPPGQPPAPPAAAVATGPVPAHAAPHEPTWQPGHTPSAGPRTAPSLAVRGPAPAHTAAPSSQAPTRPGGPARHGRRPGARRPGPPAKIALPVLLLALLCFAVGFWALARV